MPIPALRRTLDRFRGRSILLDDRATHPSQEKVGRPRRALIAASAMGLAVVSVAATVAGTTVASAAPTTYTMWSSSTTPVVASSSDPRSVELGVRFSTSAAGWVTAVRFYKGAQNTGLHTGRLWNSNGQLLGSVTFSAETGSGWQQASFAKPVQVSAGSTYIASYRAPNGRYAADTNALSPGRPKVNNALTATQGVYNYGSGAPTSTWQSANYYVDVAFTTAVTAPVTTTAPTTAATSAPASAPSGSCSAAANTPGGADPWGTCWPGPNNTGVRPGTTLTTYTGPTTISTAGTVIDSKLITGCIVIRANNVVIKNSRLQSKGCFFNILSDNGNTGLQLTDVEIDGQGNTSGDSAINGGGFTCLRCNLHGTIDGAKAQSNVVFQDSYIHDLTNTADSHNDGIQSLGTTALTLTHNTIIVKGAATSAVILSTGSASNMRNIAIKRNLMAGGAYTVYGGYQKGTDALSKVSNISITENRFSTVIYPRSGAYGPLTSVDTPVVHTGNIWADGTNAGKSAD